jgi:hypothetical protein
MQEQLELALISGLTTEDRKNLLQQKFASSLQACEAARARSAGDDAVAIAALIRAYVIQEQFLEFSGGASLQTLEPRRELLAKAAALAEPLAKDLSGSPGIYKLLGIIYVRLGRLEADSDGLKAARRALETAYGLDPTSPSIKTALAGLERL